MPTDIEGVKWACEPCVRGHRASKCSHFNRWMVRVKRPGRPLRECPHNTEGCSCGDDKVIMRPVRPGEGNCDCVRVRGFDPAFDGHNSQPSPHRLRIQHQHFQPSPYQVRIQDQNSHPSPYQVRIQDPEDPTRTIPYMNRRLLQQGSDDSNGHLPDHQQYPTLNRAPRIQGPEDPLRTIPYMNRRLLQQGSDDSNGHLPDHQQYPTPNRAPTATANDQHVPAGPYHRLPSSDAILSPRPPSTLNRFAGYTGPTQNSQSPHQHQQPHSLVQAQSPTASQGYSQFPGVGPNSSVFSSLGSLPQQFNTGNHQPQLLTIPAPLAIPGQLAMNGNQPAEPSVGPPFVNPRTGAVYDSDPRYPMTKDEKEFFESEGYTYPEPIDPFSGMDIFDDSAETPFQWPAIPNALRQTGYGATPMNGTNGAASMNGTHGAAPMYGTNGVAHMNGTNGAAPMNGTHGVAHVNGTNGAAPMNGTNGVAHMNGTNGAAHMNGTNGRFSVNVSRPSAGLNALSGPGDCQCDPCHCGPGCTCVYCRAHPYNSSTTERVQELGRILERDLQLPQPEHGVITMVDSAYRTLTYPMAHSRDDNCTGVSATCPCGSGCTCSGCLAHAGQH